MTTDIRTRILDAAVTLLETEGAKAFGQTRVARAAGVKQGNLTYHFPKKADLVAAVVERVNASRLADLQDLVDRAHSIEPRKLRALVLERLPALATEVKRSRVMLALLVEAQHDPATARLLGAVSARQRAALATLLQCDADDLDLDLVLATLSGLSLHALSAPSHGRNDDRVAALIRRFSEWLPRLLGPATPAPAAPPRAPRAAPRRSPRRAARPGRAVIS